MFEDAIAEAADWLFGGFFDDDHGEGLGLDSQGEGMGINGGGSGCIDLNPVSI